MGRRCGLHACPGGLADLMENGSLKRIRNQPKLITLEPSGRIFEILGSVVAAWCDIYGPSVAAWCDILGRVSRPAVAYWAECRALL